MVAVTLELLAKLAPKFAPKLTLLNAPAVLEAELVTACPSVFATALPTEAVTAVPVAFAMAYPVEFAIALPVDCAMLFATLSVTPSVAASDTEVPVPAAELVFQV